MDIHRSPTVVTLGDACGFQITVEDSEQPGRHLEEKRVTRNSHRDWLARFASLGLQRSQFLIEPVLKVVGKIIANRKRVPISVFLVCRVELQQGEAVREIELSNVQRSQFVRSKPSQHERLVDQGTLTPHGPQAKNGRFPQIRDGLALPLAASNGSSVEQRAFDCHGKNSLQFLFREGTAWPARVGLLIGHRDEVKVVIYQSLRCNAPVDEAHDRLSVVIPCTRRHLLFLFPVGKPTLDVIAGELCRGRKAALLCNPPNATERILSILFGCFGCDQVIAIRLEMLFKGGCSLSSGVEGFLVKRARLHLIDDPFPLFQKLLGGLLVAATGRLRHHDTVCLKKFVAFIDWDEVGRRWATLAKGT